MLKKVNEKKQAKKLAGKIFFVFRNELGFFSKCFFLSPKLTVFIPKSTTI